MDTTARLLLPFTGGINTLALDYAIQLAEQQHAQLVPLALLPARSSQGARLEHIQQAQDFLEFIRRKAQRHGTPIMPASVNTGDVSRSIEVIAGEMDCEAVILFLSKSKGVLLDHAEIQALMDRGNCNMHVVLFPLKKEKHAAHYSCHIPLLKHTKSEPYGTNWGAPSQEEEQEKLSFFHRVLGQNNFQG